MDAAPHSGRVVHRTAITGSTRLPLFYRPNVWRKLDERWQRTKPGEVFALRHGNADAGADLYGHEWAQERMANPDPRFGVVEEELVPADWENCAPTCKPLKADGSPHRRPNSRGNRGGLEDYCPAAGHRRNPDVPTHPDYPVQVLLAWIWDRSPGTSKTVEHADRAGVPSETIRDYSSRYRRTA